MDVQRDQEQEDGIERGGENLEPVIAERTFAVRSALGDPDGDQRDGKRGAVGEHVRGIGQERETARDQRRDNLDDHERRGETERDPQRPLVAGTHRALRITVRMTYAHRNSSLINFVNLRR